ncbi:MAG: Flp pilus assembly complex ATPase component TadA [Desulfuromonadaceae bacterium]|nr:Flp pilus assembly complex ATPase component TadA [Desulfuromonadaceae bacterium]
MAIIKKIRIGDLLVSEGMISEEQLQQALQAQKGTGRKLGNMLVDMGLISEDDLLAFLSRQLGIPFVDLRHFQFDPELVKIVPETLARRFRVLALTREADGVLIGMADPTDIFALDKIASRTRENIKPAVVREADLLRSLDTVYRRTDEIETIAEELGEELAQTDFNLADLLPDSQLEDAPVVRLLQTLFEDAVQVGASDIHIEPDETVLRIRQRIDGVLHEQVMKEKRIAGALVSRLKLMSGLDISERRLPQDGRFNIRVRNKNIDVRLSTMPLQYGEAVVMRLLDQSGGLLSLDQIGMPGWVLDRFRRYIHHPHGLILVTGPTGSGKTTTLYGALSELNRPQKKIITVEDPVEYRLPRINQVQVNTKVGLTFAGVLRTALRQDPDIVMVGEMRDQETVEIGLRAAMTGHLVLSTLHTNDAISTALRLLDMGAEGYVVAGSLKAILAQRLVRRVCDRCSQPDTLGPDQLGWLMAHPLFSTFSESEGVFRRGQGCTQCNNTGYHGRIGVFELLELNGELADALRRTDHAAFTQLSRHQKHFVSLADCALDYARQGLTTVEEVIRIAGQVEEV